MTFWEFANNNPLHAVAICLIGAALVDAFIDLWRKK